MTDRQTYRRTDRRSDDGKDARIILLSRVKRTDAAKLTNVRIARFRQCRDLIRESEVFVKYEAKVTSRVMSSVERRVIYFSKLLFKPNDKKFSLGGVES